MWHRELIGDATSQRRIGRVHTRTLAVYDLRKQPRDTDNN